MPASTIFVQYPDGSPGRRMKVSLGFCNGGVTDAVFTDDRGMAVVEHSSVGRAKVFAARRDCGTFHAPGKYAVTISK